MLIVAIHDVAPPFLAAVRTLRDRLAAWGVDAVTLLAVPDFHGAAPLAACPATAAWLRQQVDRGDEVALHGLRHRQEQPARRRRDRWRAAALTAGEGEMLGAGAAAPHRLSAARAELAALVGASIDGFVAPAWLEPAGLASVLAGLGFAWHETAFVVEGLTGPDAPRHRTPVIGFATRARWRELAAIGWAAALTPMLGRLVPRDRPVRVAFHPADLGSAAVMRAAERTVRALLVRHRPVTTATALRA